MLSLHDALPISSSDAAGRSARSSSSRIARAEAKRSPGDGASAAANHRASAGGPRSEEHTSELQSLMRISYAVFCLKNKNSSANTNSPSLLVKYPTNQ